MKRLLFPYLNQDWTFFTSTTQLPKDIMPYEIKIVQTQRYLKALSKRTFQPYKELTLTHPKLEVMAI